MLNNLPLEVLETLCFYVEVEDLLNVWNVVGVDGSESFWRKICKRQGYKQITCGKSSWKSVFERNINWLTQTYVKRTYKLEPNIIDVWQTASSQSKELLFEKHLVVNSDGEESLVWDLSSSPTIVERFSAKYVSHKGNKLLTYNSSEVAVYSYNTQTFSKIYEMPVKLPLNFLKLCSFTDDYFVLFDKNISCIKVVDLRALTEYSLKLSVPIPMIISLALSKNFLLILTLEESNYKIKRFDLMDRGWLQDLVVFGCAALIGVPQLEFSSNLIVTWSNQLEVPGITPVKVFGLDGKYITSLPSTSLESNGTELSWPIEDILWMIVECDYVIFSTSKTTISIWSSDNLNYVKVIPKEDKLHNGQKVVSSSLLVLSYSYCFKVVDLKETVYLYEVLIDNQCSLDSFQSLHHFVSEYFYVYFQFVEEENIKICTNKMLPIASSLYFECNSKDISTKKCFLYVYDFTGTFSL